MPMDTRRALLRDQGSLLPIGVRKSEVLGLNDLPVSLSARTGNPTWCIANAELGLATHEEQLQHVRAHNPLLLMSS